MQKVLLQIDKSMAVPPGCRVIVDYVPTTSIILGCSDVMAIGDVNEKYQLVKQNAPNSLYPTPMGEWKDGRFIIIDGRHTTIAYIMHGYEFILVSWLDCKNKNND